MMRLCFLAERGSSDETLCARGLLRRQELFFGEGEEGRGDRGGRGRR